MYCELQKGQKAHAITSQPLKASELPEGVFRVVFSDGMYKEYSVQQLSRVDFFKGMIDRFSESVSRVVHLQNVRSDVFEVVLGLTLRGQHISELIAGNSDLNYRPDLYEVLKDVLDYFNPGKNGELLEELKDRQLTHITYEEAAMILENYGAGKGEETPVWVGIAKTISLCHIYFNTEEELQKWTEKKKICDKELWAAGRKVNFHRRRFIKKNLSKIEQSLELAQIQALNIYRVTLGELSDHWHSRWESLPMICHQRASECQSDDPEVKRMAEESKKNVADYKHEVRQTLEASGADMDREDLLEHIIGPENFLFDEYGLTIPGEPELSQYPFGHCLLFNGQSRLGYSLDNLSPYELESEIRKDLKGYIPNELPPRIIQTDEATRPVTAEVQQLRDFFMEKLLHWHSIDDETQRQVVQKLIECSGWDDIGIVSEEVSIIELEVLPNQEVAGRMLIQNRPFEFFFNTFDFMVCFIGEGGVRINHYGSMRTLRLLNLPHQVGLVYDYLVRNGIVPQQNN